MLSCSCDFDSAAEWYYIPQKFGKFSRKRRKRCCSCDHLISNGDICLTFDRHRYPLTDIEEKICGDEVPLADWFMCEKCGETFLNLSDLGFCIELGSEMAELLSDYWKLTGFKPKNTTKEKGEKNVNQQKDL